jgi:hypothetical protein
MNEARASLESEAAQARAMQRQVFARNDERLRRVWPMAAAAQLRQRELIRRNAYRVSAPWPCNWSAQHWG